MVKSLLIRGRKWKLTFKENLKCPETRRPLFGLCDPGSATIFVEKNMPKEFILETIIHEYLHACCYEQGVHDEDVPLWYEHMIVNSVAKDMTNNSSFIKQIFKLWG